MNNEVMVEGALENLQECKTYCNEGQIFPAMRHLVEDKKLSIRGAAIAVEEKTEGAITRKRAKMVYYNRTGGGSDEPVKKKPKKEPKPKTELPSIDDMPTATDEYALKLINMTRELSELIRLFSGDILDKEVEQELITSLAVLSSTSNGLIKKIQA